MRNLIAVSLFASAMVSGQAVPARSAPTATASTATGPAPGMAFVRENYSKYEYRIPMRDGVQLFTSVYVPKDVVTDGKTYPIMMDRTPYSVAPYGVDRYRTR